MPKRFSKIFILLVFLAAFSGCDKIPFFKAKPKAAAKNLPPQGVTVVAKIGTFYVTADDLNKEVEDYNSLVSAQGMTQNKIDTRDKKIAYLRNEVVRKYMLYQEALDRGVDKKEDIMQKMENAKISLLVQELLRQEIEKIDISSKEIEDFYNQNKDMLREPEQRRIFEIMASDESGAKQAYIELLRGGDFVSLAKQYSKAQSASSGGDLGFMTLDPDPKKRTKFDKFYEVAFSPTLEQGGTSNIFKGPEGYYIIKIESINKPEAKSLSELWDNIKAWLLFEKQQKVIADLANKLSGETKVEVYEGKVE